MEWRPFLQVSAPLWQAQQAPQRRKWSALEQLEYLADLALGKALRSLLAAQDHQRQRMFLCPGKEPVGSSCHQGTYRSAEEYRQDALFRLTSMSTPRPLELELKLWPLPLLRQAQPFPALPWVPPPKPGQEQQSAPWLERSLPPGQSQKSPRPKVQALLMGLAPRQRLRFAGGLILFLART